MEAWKVLGANFLLAIAFMVSLWPYATWKRKASLADRFWGLGFVVIAWATFFLGSGYLPRRLLALILVTLWGLRLSAYITLRSWGKGEDPRYAAMRERHGDRFSLVSLFTVFGVQGVLLWMVSLPVQWAQIQSEPVQLTAWDALGVLLWAAGFTVESLADHQMARFKANPENRGKVMDRGLWRYSRHPNYFGETLIWWGLFGLALAAEGGFWTIVGPLCITTLLLRVSGVTLLEKTMLEKRPQYRRYMERTRAFIPWFPKE